MKGDCISRELAITAMTADELLANFDSIEDAIENRFHRAAERVLAGLPAADVVEVVRCGHCKHCVDHYDTDGNAPYWTCKEWDSGTDYAGNPDYDPRREDHRGGLQPSSIIRNLRECGDGDCRRCSLIILRYAGCQNRLMLAAADTIEHLLERERRRKQT